MNEETQFKIIPYIVRIGKLLPWAIFFAMIIFDWIYKAELSRYLDYIKSLHTEYYIMEIAGIILFSRFIEVYQSVKHEDS